MCITITTKQFIIILFFFYKYKKKKKKKKKKNEELFTNSIFFLKATNVFFKYSRVLGTIGKGIPKQFSINRKGL